MHPEFNILFSLLSEQTSTTEADFHAGKILLLLRIPWQKNVAYISRISNSSQGIILDTKRVQYSDF